MVSTHVAGPNPYNPGAPPTIILRGLKYIDNIDDVTLIATGRYKAIPVAVNLNVVTYRLREPAAMGNHLHGNVVVPDAVALDRVLIAQWRASNTVAAHDINLAVGGAGGGPMNVPAGATHIILDVRFNDAVPAAGLGCSIGEGVTGNYVQNGNNSVVTIFGERLMIVPIGAGTTINVTVTASGIGTADADIYGIGFVIPVPAASAGTPTDQEVPGGDLSGQTIYAIVKGRQARPTKQV